MRKKLISFIISICLLIVPTFILSGCSNNDNYTPVVIMAGQSNMVGYTQTKYITSQYIDETRANKLKETNNYVLISDANNNSGRFDGVDLSYGGNQYSFGPEVGMAEKLSKLFNEKTNQKIYLIKYAVGGTNLYNDWQSPTMANNTDGSYVYSQFTDYVDTMLNQLKKADLKPKIVAFTWMQGESDAMVKDKASQYGKHLKLFVNDIREKYNKYASTRILNFVDAYINTHPEYHEVVNGHKKNFSQLSHYNYCLNTLSPNLVIDGMDGLTTTLEDSYTIGPIDPNHYDSLSMLKLGNMMGEKVLELLKK